MTLSNVNIKLENGALGRVSASADGVAGLILTGKTVVGKLDLNKVYLLSSPRDLVTLGITAETNTLAHKDILAFYAQAGEGAELYLLVVSEATTLTQMCGAEDASPLKKLVDHAKGRIRLIGINRTPPAEYEAATTETGIDNDAVLAATAAQLVAESYAKQINPFRMFIPALLWDDTTDKLFKPREASSNRVGLVLAADVKFGQVASAAIGQVLGRAALIPVNYSIARVKNGAIAASGFLTSGKKPEECAGLHELLNDAGYIFYRLFVGKNGYYLNDDCLSAPLSDDYSNLNLGRVIDKAMIIAYTAYIDEIQDSIEVDDKGELPQYLCTYFESNIENAIAMKMQNEISQFTAYINPAQNVLSSSKLEISCKITPKGITRNINVTLGFDNPALK